VHEGRWSIRAHWEDLKLAEGFERGGGEGVFGCAADGDEMC